MKKFDKDVKLLLHKVEVIESALTTKSSLLKDIKLILKYY
jgi:hypothetical protein